MEKIRSASTVFTNFFTQSSPEADESDIRFLRHVTSVLGNQLRIAVMGAKGVGKTTVVDSLRTHLKDNPDVDSRNSGPTFKKGQFSIEIMDADQRMPPNFKNLFIRNANVFILIYDVTDKCSFEQLSEIRDEIIGLKGESVPMIVLGNKLDKGYRDVHPIVADCIVTIDWEAFHYELSANDSSSLNCIIEHLLGQPSIKTIKKSVEMDAESLIKRKTVTMGSQRRRKSSIINWFRSNLVQMI